MKVFQKLMNVVSDIRDDIKTLSNRELSPRFRFLNLLSGDRLRVELAFAQCHINDAEENLRDLSDRFGGDDAPTPADIEYDVTAALWHLRRARKNLQEIGREL